MQRKNSGAKDEAVAILRGKYEKPSKIWELVKKLKSENRFGLARKIIGRAIEDPEIGPEIGKDSALKLKLGQQHALCTYKDPDLPIGDRLNRAFAILDQADNVKETKDQETLGIAGAICKRRWEVEGAKKHLEQALACYQRGYMHGVEKDHGYTGINAAYVLDVLANLEEEQSREVGALSDTAVQRRNDADVIRQQIVSVLPVLIEKEAGLDQAYWFLVTVAEAYFGLGQYDHAGRWLQKARKLPELPPWELESTARQLAAIYRLRHQSELGNRDVQQTAAWKVLEEFLDGRAGAVSTMLLGKVGLALSGGGFRASLFHIGVLAKLAEMDVLRHVEVLSCVSGGSIIGAHYYLEIRKLLTEKSDQEVTREDYVEIVQRIAKRFLTGVQRNIRTRVAAEFDTNLKMIFQRDYSRTQRVGELYEEELFAMVEDGEGDQPRWLNHLYIHPKGEDGHFAPKYDNWRRSAKVPILILNATTLNTGHNWQFTASWMGEPPSAINTDVDGNYRLRRMYYHDAPKEHRQVRLGHAVAASACVPGLFEPIVLYHLYRRDTGNITVRLVDGGVHDNQGTMGLLDQDCTAIMVSDASGQMGTKDDPGKGFIGVPLRSNSILMARVREAEYRELHARLRSSLLRNLMFIHLKKDLDVTSVDWIGCQEPVDASDKARPVGQLDPLTGYKILKVVQEKLAAIRTDLDSFSDAEAYALMTSGYRMTEEEFPDTFHHFTISEAAPPQWAFLRIHPAMQDRSKSDRLLKILTAGSQRAFKIWRLSKPLEIAGWAIICVVVVLFLWICWRWSSVALLTLGGIGSGLVLFALGAVFGKFVMKIVRFKDTLKEIATGVGMALVGWAAAQIHLRVFDRLFLKKGRIQD
ncbi:MAG: patatin-like phospholipase family protein [Desulfobacteraceae bacterium]